MKTIQFTRSPMAFKLAYFKDDIVEMEDKKADVLIKAGYAIKVEAETKDGTDIPEDIPAREIFVDLGFSFEEIKQIPDFTQIKGIGKATALKIEAYLEG